MMIIYHKYFFVGDNDNYLKVNNQSWNRLKKDFN